MKKPPFCVSVSLQPVLKEVKRFGDAYRLTLCRHKETGNYSVELEVFSDDLNGITVTSDPCTDPDAALKQVAAELSDKLYCDPALVAEGVQLVRDRLRVRDGDNGLNHVIVAAVKEGMRLAKNPPKAGVADEVRALLEGLKVSPNELWLLEAWEGNKLYCHHLGSIRQYLPITRNSLLPSDGSVEALGRPRLVFFDAKTKMEEDARRGVYVGRWAKAADVLLNLPIKE